jgi:hypothetical protein
MRIRPLAYFILLLLDIYMLYTLFQLYSSPGETVTYAPIGFLSVPKTRILIALIGTILMLPNLATLLYGAIVQAEWLSSVRFYTGITAMMVGVCEVLPIRPPAGLYSFLDIALLYLIAEGLIVVAEGVKRG